jgi:YD repeat-containing protein
LLLSDGTSYGFSYDLSDRRKTATVPNGNTPVKKFGYDYDAVGNQTSYTEKDSNDNTLSQIAKPATGDMYSKTDQLLGFDLTYGTSAVVTHKYSYTMSGLLTDLTAGSKSWKFLSNDGKNLLSQLNPNTTTDNFTYNNANQITDSRTLDVGNNVKWSSQYEYDNDGRLIGITGNGAGSPSAEYVYNDTGIGEKLNRLTKATITTGDGQYILGYKYDPVGNLLSMSMPSGQKNTFTYNDDNQIATINGSASAASYDANGNLTALTVNGKSYRYVYDAANRLKTVQDGAGATIASYTYDGDGRRLTKTANGETITYHYFKDQLLFETSDKYPGKYTARYIRTPDGKLLAVYLYRPAGDYYNYYYYHYNAQGDVVAVTDSNGAVYRQYVYDPYGNVVSVKDASGTAV